MSELCNFLLVCLCLSLFGFIPGDFIGLYTSLERIPLIKLKQLTENLSNSRPVINKAYPQQFQHVNKVSLSILIGYLNFCVQSSLGHWKLILPFSDNEKLYVTTNSNVGRTSCINEIGWMSSRSSNWKTKLGKYWNPSISCLNTSTPYIVKQRSTSTLPGILLASCFSL